MAISTLDYIANQPVYEHTHTAGPRSQFDYLGPVAPTPPAPTPPVVGNISPAPGTPIDPYTKVSLEVTDAGGLGTVRLYAFLADGSRDLVYHPTFGFSPKYAPGSRIEAITNGNRFHVVPAAGWQSSTSPSLVVDASDQGLENT